PTQELSRAGASRFHRQGVPEQGAGRKRSWDRRPQPSRRRGEARAPPSSMLRAVSFDVLVVLGCRVRDGQLSHAALRRVERAFEAYRDEGATLVIASGGKSWAGFQECKVFANGLVSRGMPAEHVLEEAGSLTT